MDHVEEVVRGFGLGSRAVVVGPPARGELGRVWRVETSSGTWAVKELFGPETEEEADRAAEFQEAAAAAGVPVPALVRTDTGRVLLEIGGRQHRVFSWVGVRPPDSTLDPVAVGRLVASIHRLRFPDAGPVHPWYTEPVGADGWDDLVRRMERARFPLADRLAAAVPELVALEALLTPPTDLQRLHLDLWADNVRASDAGGLCVLDWDSSGAGDPSQELAVVLFEFCSWSRRRAAELHRSYVDAGGHGRITRPGDFSTAIAQLGHILERQCRNWLTGGTAASRAHAEEAVDEHLSRPMTTEVVQRVVAAVM